MSEASKWGRALGPLLKGLGVLILLLGLMMWLSGTFVAKVEPGPPVSKPQPPALNTVRVESHTFPLLMELAGTVRSQTEAQVSSRIMAQVQEILVIEGELVKGPEVDGEPGTPMARLDDREIQAKLRQAQAQMEATTRALGAARSQLEAEKAQLEAAKARLDQALSDYRRYEDLRRNQAATGQQLEQKRVQKEVAEAQVKAARQQADAREDEIRRVQAQIEQAQAGVTEAQTMLSYTVIRAPFAGQVIRKMVDIGDMLAPGQPLFLINIASRPQLHAYVAESLIPYVHVGQTLKVEIDALSADLEGTVLEIVPQAEPVSRTTLVKISLPPGPELVTGLYGRVAIPYGQYEALVIPIETVQEIGQIHLVTVLDTDGYPHRRFVTLGKRYDEFVEVLTGLQEGEEVVLP
jgi:HlyD family secretion protein